MLIDVIVLTKNSDLHLTECLKAIYENIPINNLIIVDGYSTDQTIEIIQKFKKRYKNVLLLKDHGTRATARQKGIRQVRTNWFMFVDSDVVLCKDWYEKVKPFIEQKVGLIWGLEIWSTLKNHSILKIFLLVTKKIFNIRGGTHDTLIQTNLVKDMVIPSELHVFEDTFIKNWIEKKGYLSISCYDPFCIHYRPKKAWTLIGSLTLISESLRIGNFQLIAKLLLAYGFYTAYSIYQLIIPKNKS
jgi:glycosyltransferase involved in cell wall biosynthesis